ncbi:hypothetical protein Tco_0892976 [Tanacetum coccineum]|uniref:Uncharacterized protein n=1 Tax=Tanacetum coccineum TaxID=301880 RepID=A0ABQ5CCU4_9ASTR
MHRSERIEDDVTHRVRAGWAKLRVTVLADHESASKQGGSVKLRMLSYVVRIRALTDHESASKQGGSAKLRMLRLGWFGHVQGRPQSTSLRSVEAFIVEGLKRRGRPKLRWEDRLKQDMKELLLFEDMTLDRNVWRDRIMIGG